MKPNGDHSDEKAYRVAYLIAGYIRKTLTIEEHDELDAWVEASDDNMRLFEDLTDEKNIEANLAWMDNVQTEKALEKIKSRLHFNQPKKEKKRVKLWPYIAAACIISVVAATFFLLMDNSKGSNNTPGNTLVANDIIPGGNRATLTLSNGTVIDLEKYGLDTINDKGITISKKAQGELMYAKLNEIKELIYNTISTPNGGQYTLTLSDGTKVWLNAQTQLKFPVQFTDSLRLVELNGEAYFEVAKNRNKPFIVRLNDNHEIKVLGTEFNVMAYTNEETREVSLLEGRVQVSSHFKRMDLVAGQQALLKQGTISLKSKPDLDAATGWKRGEFVFHDEDIYQLMRQVERWYNVNVIFKTTSSEHFNATISRNEPLSKLLQLLEHTGKINFKIENKTIYVLP